VSNETVLHVRVDVERQGHLLLQETA
jgi:hypothetical protein